MGNISKKREQLSELTAGIASGSREELLSLAVSQIGGGGVICTPNAKMLEMALKDPKLYAVLRESICIPDGAGAKYIMKRAGIITDTLPGVELGEELLAVGNIRFGIIGAVAGIGERAGEYLSGKYKNTECLFTLPGYGISDEAYLKTVLKYRPHIVFVCLGSPRQELVASWLHEACGSCLYLCLGGSLDIYSGKKKRAPAVFRRLSLEWLYRMLVEPRRLGSLPGMLRACLLYAESSGQKGKNHKKHTKRV